MAFEKLSELISKKSNPTVMGLDPMLNYVPQFIRDGKSISEALFEFNKGLIDCTADLIPAVKPQSAFYEQYGSEGMKALDMTVEYAAKAGLYVILDVKRNDIGSTAEAYATAFLSEGTGIDCITVNPYLGIDGIKPFITKAKETGKSMFILVKTSNPSSSDFQDLDCGGLPLYRRVADKVVEWGSDSIASDGYNVCGAVIGATHPKQLEELRVVMPNTFILVPGYGAQGGTAQDLISAFDKNGNGAIVNSSRGLMCAYMKKDDDTNYQKYTREAVIAMKEDLATIIK
jgi:orotidine 5''-phosphate decarboxylase, subfamily 2